MSGKRVRDDGNDTSSDHETSYSAAPAKPRASGGAKKPKAAHAAASSASAAAAAAAAGSFSALMTAASAPSSSFAGSSSSVKKESKSDSNRTEYLQRMEGFWEGQLAATQAPSATLTSVKPTLPLARIKKIMKSDEDVRAAIMISGEAPLLLCKACELFTLDLTMRAWAHTDATNRRTLQRSDVADAVATAEQFDFLLDTVPRDEAAVAQHVPISASTVLSSFQAKQHPPQPQQQPQPQQSAHQPHSSAAVRPAQPQQSQPQPQPHPPQVSHAAVASNAYPATLAPPAAYPAPMAASSANNQTAVYAHYLQQQQMMQQQQAYAAAAQQQQQQQGYGQAR